MATNKNSLLVVLGATGNQGSAVLKHFAKNHRERGVKLRGTTRDPESESSKELSNLGIEMVKADLDDLESLEAAFAGATHIFATTDSNRLIFDAAKNPHKMKSGETPRSFARRIELGQGKNIATAAASTSTLQRIVYSSLPSPKRWSHGKYTKVSMFDTKEDIADIMADTPELKNKLSVLLIGFYATNALSVPKLYGPLKRDDGVYELSLAMSGDAIVPIADLETDLGEWTHALFEAEPGIVLVGSTETMTWKQWLSMWARHNQVQAEYRQAYAEEYAARVEGISDAVAEELAFVEEFGFAGGNPEAIYPDELRKRGIDLPHSTIEQQIRRTDWTSLL